MMKRKVKRYAAGSSVYEDDEPSLPSGRTQMSDPYEDAPEFNRARAIAEGEKISEGERVSNMPASDKPARTSKTKVVTKEELAKSGLSLRDYLNKQQGLTRRGEPTVKVVKTESKVEEAPEPKVVKSVEKYETPYDRKNRQNREAGIDFDSMVGKLKNRIMGASDSGQDRIITGMRKNAGTNMGMGSGMKKGGKVSSASSRADGCCIRGKTRA